MKLFMDIKKDVKRIVEELRLLNTTLDQLPETLQGDLMNCRLIERVEELERQLLLYESMFNQNPR